MNREAMQSNWKLLKDRIKLNWSELGEKDLESFKGTMHEAIDSLQKTYGYSKDQAQQEYENFKKSNSTLFKNETVSPKKEEQKINHEEIT